MATSAHDSTSAGDSYSGSSGEIAHTSSESEAPQISNKTVLRITLNCLLCYNITFDFFHVNDMTHKKISSMISSRIGRKQSRIGSMLKKIGIA